MSKVSLKAALPTTIDSSYAVATRGSGLALPGGVRLPLAPSMWLFAASMMFAPLSSLNIVMHVSVCDVLLVLAAMAALIERVFMREIVPAVPAFFLVLLLFTLSFFANLPSDGLLYWKTFMVTVVAGVLTPMAIAMMRIRDLPELKFLLMAWTLGGLIGALFILAYCNGYIPGHLDRFWFYHGRARGLTHHPNLSGLSCLLTIPGLILLYSATRSLLLKAVALLLMLAVLKALDYTGARSSFIAAGVLLAVWLALTLFTLLRAGRLSRSRAVVTGVLTVIGAGAVTAYGALGGNLAILGRAWARLFSGDYVAQHSVMVRERLSNRALDGFFNHPVFGEGYGWMAFTQPEVAHNIYLQYLQALGIAGFLGLMIILLYPLIYPIRCLLRPPSFEAEQVNNVLLAAAAAELVWLVAQSGFADFGATLLFCLLLNISLWRVYHADLKTSP
jgi:hypothetical protein